MKKEKKQKKFVDFDSNAHKVLIEAKAESFPEKPQEKEEINLVPSTLKLPKKPKINKQNTIETIRNENV